MVDMHKKIVFYLCTSIKKSERMDFSIDFFGGVLYIYDSDGEHSADFSAWRMAEYITSNGLKV